MLSETDTTEPTSTAAVHDWFARFEDALAGSDEARLSGLWFIAGSLAQCRIYSKYLAQQIKACEEGLLSVTRHTRS